MNYLIKFRVASSNVWTPQNCHAWLMPGKKLFEAKLHEFYEFAEKRAANAAKTFKE